MWESRVLRRAFERLELHEGKLSRAVLRGGGGGDVTSLPDLWGVTPRATRPCSVRFNRATSLKEAARAGWWMLTQILVKPPRIMESQRLSITVRDERPSGHRQGNGPVSADDGPESGG